MTWEKPLFDGNNQITGYKLQVKTSVKGVVYSETHMIMQKNVTKLDPFRNYTFNVSALNKVGLGRPATLQIQTNSEGRILFFTLTQSHIMIQYNANCH